MKRILYIFFVILIASPCFASTYYVSTTGNNASNGSLATPWRTIQKCVDSINSGDVCIIKNGVYAESIIKMSRSGSSFYPLNIRAENRRKAIVNGRIDISGSYINIDGLKIVMQPNALFGINSTGNYVNIQNCYIDGSQNSLGMNSTSLTMAGQYSTAASNYATGTCFGISLGGQSNTISGNEVESLKKATNCGDLDYMRFFGTGHVIKDNLFHGVDLSSVGSAHVDCFQFFDNPGPQFSIQNVLIEGNFCRDAHQGIMMRADLYKLAKNITIRNNVFKKCYGFGISAHYITNVKVFNNTFDLQGGVHGVGCRIGSSCEIKNNIFYNGNTTYWFENSTIIDGTAAAPGKNNLLYRAGYTISGYANDIRNKDPLFVDSDNDNYKLQSISPAIKTGMVIGEWANADDKTLYYRPKTAWSIGAYEYTGYSGGTKLKSATPAKY